MASFSPYLPCDWPYHVWAFAFRGDARKSIPSYQQKWIHFLLQTTFKGTSSRVIAQLSALNTVKSIKTNRELFRIFNLNDTKMFKILYFAQANNKQSWTHAFYPFKQSYVVFRESKIHFSTMLLSGIGGASWGSLFRVKIGNLLLKDLNIPRIIFWAEIKSTDAVNWVNNEQICIPKLLAQYWKESEEGTLFSSKPTCKNKAFFILLWEKAKSFYYSFHFSF